MKRLLIAVGLAVTFACSGETLLAPSSPAVGGTTEVIVSNPTVTLLPNLTSSPPLVWVTAGKKVKFINSSARYAVVHSYNCSEFSGVNLPPGGYVNTWVFRPAGKVCDYFVWDVNWSRKLFVGQVAVK